MACGAQCYLSVPYWPTHCMGAWWSPALPTAFYLDVIPLWKEAGSIIMTRQAMGPAARVPQLAVPWMYTASVW